jgi:hypothetical protein
MAKVLFFAHDPGGANAIAPLISPLRAEGHQIVVCAKGPAVKILPQAEPLPEDPLKTLTPDIVITGTSANDMSEKNLWRESQEELIPCIAILDHWVNYGVRFSKYGLREIEAYQRHKEHECLPSYIVVMDEFARQEMISEGFSPKCLVALGNPHFEAVIENAKKIDCRKTRQNLGIREDTKLITFASEPYIEDYGQGPELDALSDLLEGVAELNANVEIVVRPHPKEHPEKFSKFGFVHVDKQTPYCESILASDLVVSMTSMFLIESLILGKNVISYQLGVCSKDGFILTRNQVLPFITTKQELKKELKAFLFEGKNSKGFNAGVDAINRNLAFIKGVLCQNQC